MACSKRSFLMALCLGVAAVATITREVATNAVTHVYALCVRAVDWVIERIAHEPVKDQARAAALRAPVLLVQARAFVQRLAKRETPRVTPGWRMCPST